MVVTSNKARVRAKNLHPTQQQNLLCLALQEQEEQEEKEEQKEDGMAGMVFAEQTGFSKKTIPIASGTHAKLLKLQCGRSSPSQR